MSIVLDGFLAGNLAIDGFGWLDEVLSQSSGTINTFEQFRSSMLALTRAQIRDNIRHNLNKLTSLDTDPINGKVGDPDITQPWPGNNLINKNLFKALSFVNRKAGFNEISNVNINVPISTATPQVFNLRFVGIDQGLSLGQINEIRSIWWTDGTIEPIRIHPVARDEMDRDGVPYMSWPSSTPRRFSMDGYSLSLYPGSSTGGTLSLIVGAGIVGFMTDIDTIETLPIDYHWVIEDVATSMVAATQVMDAEMTESAKMYGANGADGVKDIEKWVNRKNVEQQRSMEVKSQAGYYATNGSRR